MAFCTCGKGWELIEQTGAGFVQENLAFVAMSFEPTLMPAFDAVVLGAENAGYVAKRVDSDLHADQIDLRLIDMMRMSRFVIADLTDQKRNVYFEAGFAKGMDKPVIWTVRKDQLELLAFDIKQFYFIAWESEADLAMRLEQAIGAIIGRRKK